MLYAAIDPRIRYTAIEETPLAVINYDSELKRAGAHSTHGWRKLPFLAQRHLLGAIGLVIMVTVRAGRDAWPISSRRYDPLSVDSTASSGGPRCGSIWLGADFFGRDVWSRIVHGARISLAVGVGSTLLGSSIGVIVGLASGYLSRLGRSACSSASPTSCRPCRCWCWRW